MMCLKYSAVALTMDVENMNISGRLLEQLQGV